jgi:apolipoprotein D and lipocalin family protein
MFITFNKLSKTVLASVLVLSLTCCALHAPDDPPATVSRVDLQRYLGKWYEIAHIPNRFQRSCSHGTTAEYRQTGTGHIEVLNSCIRDDGSVDQAAGIARVVDPDTNARLQVSFVQLLGINLFWGDYWILGLDSGYNYAFVGDPGRKYGWVLSRKPELGALGMARIWDMVQQQGYNPDDFSLTAQVPGRPGETD